jgi:hypothetical protein
MLSKHYSFYCIDCILYFMKMGPIRCISLPHCNSFCCGPNSRLTRCRSPFQRVDCCIRPSERPHVCFCCCNLPRSFPRAIGASVVCGQPGALSPMPSSSKRPNAQILHSPDIPSHYPPNSGPVVVVGVLYGGYDVGGGWCPRTYIIASHLQ